MDVNRHEEEARRNLERWERKPVLREVYRGFHEAIAGWVDGGIPGLVVEVGSGIGNIRDVIPGCLRTDLFPSPWLDRTENAYRLSFGDGTVSNLILFDVFHHLRYPGTALEEFRRVLAGNGRVILFEPYVSLLGLVLFGLAHEEPVALLSPIEWFAPDGFSPAEPGYHAAQGNATRVFGRPRYRPLLEGWDVLEKRPTASLSWAAAGGYSGPQLYPDRWLPGMRRLDAVLDRWPLFFGTRVLVVLRKRVEGGSPGSLRRT